MSILVFCYPRMRELLPFQTRGTGFCSDLDVNENVLIEISNISFESTQNKQQYGSNIASTEVMGEGGLY